MPTIHINNKIYDYNSAPDHCPLCHNGIVPSLLGSNSIERGQLEGDIIQILYRCPRRDCQRAFIATYQQNFGYTRHYAEGPHILKSTAPYRAVQSEIPDEIKQISVGYADVLSQSESAEAYQLDQIAGAGYRKSLEFLIKDYAIFKNSQDKENIEKSFLGDCINKYIDDENVKQCAKRAAWLGNDETHYVRKWKEKDINDLKVLIRLTQGWILNNLLTEKYLSEMK